MITASLLVPLLGIGTMYLHIQDQSYKSNWIT